MFRFKQFTVHQENSAMKVCTDACLFGAVIDFHQPEKALDIGTGTGLLSLMVAQRFPELIIDAVEMDTGAVKDASKNIYESNFSNQIRLNPLSIQEFAQNNIIKYDLIFSNPPFYENHLKSPYSNKNRAHHASELSFSELSKISCNLLKENGSLWILLPPAQMRIFEKESSNNAFFKKNIIRVRHNENKPVFREIIEFTRQDFISPVESEILIYENGEYSRIFTTFLRNYYLIF